MRNKTLASRFVQHHLANHKMWLAYESIALKAVANGRENLGVGALTEILRWDNHDVGDKADGYKLSNSFRAFYARLFAHTHPEHRDLFRFKPSAADYVDYAALAKGDTKGALNISPERGRLREKRLII